MVVEQIKSIIEEVEYKQWTLKILEENRIIFLQVVFEKKCSCGRDLKMIHYGRKWRISPKITKSELVQTAFKAIISAEEHEIREDFKYKGASIYGPHFNIENLVEIYQRKKFDMRTNSFEELE